MPKWKSTWRFRSFSIMYLRRTSGKLLLQISPWTPPPRINERKRVRGGCAQMQHLAQASPAMVSTSTRPSRGPALWTPLPLADERMSSS